MCSLKYFVRIIWPNMKNECCYSFARIKSKYLLNCVSIFSIYIIHIMYQCEHWTYKRIVHRQNDKIPELCMNMYFNLHRNFSGACCRMKTPFHYIGLFSPGADWVPNKRNSGKAIWKLKTCKNLTLIVFIIWLFGRHDMSAMCNRNPLFSRKHIHFTPEIPFCE